MARTKKSKPKNRTTKKGRPANVPLDIQPRDKPENYPTVLAYLEAKGRVKHTSFVQMMRARNLFYKGVSSVDIAKDVKIDPAIIDRWSLIFGWEEERDRRLFERFRKVSGLRDRMSKDLGERHDRIAGSIEQCTERLLTNNANGQMELSPRDLATIASTVKTTQEIRRVARGQSVEKKEVNVGINMSIPASMERLANAVTDAYASPVLTQNKTKTISVQVGSEALGNDAEYEILEDSDE